MNKLFLYNTIVHSETQNDFSVHLRHVWKMLVIHNL